jgi:hypothetical protein
MDAMQIRQSMAAKGWASEDRLTKQGWGDKVGYSIWFSRYDWHGKRALVLVGNKACYHAHTSDLSRIDEAVARAADRADTAWEHFPDRPPEQGADGSLTPGRLISLDPVESDAAAQRRGA